jgi:hypothetical protein
MPLSQWHGSLPLPIKPDLSLSGSLEHRTSLNDQTKSCRDMGRRDLDGQTGPGRACEIARQAHKGRTDVYAALTSFRL